MRSCLVDETKFMIYTWYMILLTQTGESRCHRCGGGVSQVTVQ